MLVYYYYYYYYYTVLLVYYYYQFYLASLFIFLAYSHCPVPVLDPMKPTPGPTISSKQNF